MTVFAVGGMGDHIHILFRLLPTLSLVRAIGPLAFKLPDYQITQLLNLNQVSRPPGLPFISKTKRRRRDTA